MSFATLSVILFISIGTAYIIQVLIATRNIGLTTKQKEAFVRNGYVVLKGVVPLEKAEQALQFVDEAFANEKYSVRKNTDDKLPSFYAKIQESTVLTDLVLKTGIIDALEDLYGTGNVAILGNAGQVAFRPRSDRMIAKGFQKSQPIGNTAWHIDDGPGGKYVKSSSCFTTLVGVPLSSGQEVDDNRGQLNVWPGSHTVIHPIICKRLKQNLTIENGHSRFGSDRPQLGQPTRVLMRMGDAVFAHQRLGHAGGINLVDETRKIIYFRVLHVKHQEFLVEYLEGRSVFTSFEGLRGLVDT